MNEYRMAINRLQCGNTAHSCKSDYIKLAIKAIEKQIPQKMIKLDFKHDWDFAFECPNCSTQYSRHYKDKKYCLECGQSLDWSEE